MPRFSRGVLQNRGFRLPGGRPDIELKSQHTSDTGCPDPERKAILARG